MKPVVRLDVTNMTGVHTEHVCHGRGCVVHHPSDHHMNTWPCTWRDDRGIAERRCPHGIGHPDPDDTTTDRIHGCDGCCFTNPKENT